MRWQRGTTLLYVDRFNADRVFDSLIVCLATIDIMTTKISQRRTVGIGEGLPNRGAGLLNYIAVGR